jgi:septal ring factor EnvC (AmiA/AmiB activator)
MTPLQQEIVLRALNQNMDNIEKLETQISDMQLTVAKLQLSIAQLSTASNPTQHQWYQPVFPTYGYTNPLAPITCSTSISGEQL